MIFEYLNYALVCLLVLFLVIIFSFYRSSRYRIFDNKNFSKTSLIVYLLAIQAQFH